MSEGGVSPHVSRCALLFATPVSREEFVTRAAGVPPSDYLGKMLARGGPPTVVFEEQYARVARVASDLIATASHLGATVYRRAGLRELSLASISHDRLILVAHWRGAAVSSADLLIGPDEFAQIIAMKRGPMTRALSNVSPPEVGIVDGLNRAIQNRSLIHLLPAPLALVASESAALGRTLCRDLVDEAFDGLIAPGNRLELFDGMHSLQAIDLALSRNFNGELDLTMCNSEALATYLDLRRGNRIRHSHWPDLIHPIPQFLIISEALKRLAEVGGSYLDARLGIEERL